MWLDCCLCTRDARLLRQAADFIEYKLIMNWKDRQSVFLPQGVMDNSR